MASVSRKGSLDGTELSSLSAHVLASDQTASYSSQIDAYSSRFTEFEETGNRIKSSLADPNSRPAAIASLHAYLLRNLPNRDLKNSILQALVVSENKQLKQNIRIFFSQIAENSSAEREALDEKLSALQSQANKIVRIWESENDDCRIL